MYSPLVPLRQLRASLLQDEPPQLDDQTGLLRHGDELGRGNPAALRVPPSRQRLHAGQGTVGQLELRLEKHLERALRQRLS